MYILIVSWLLCCVMIFPEEKTSNPFATWSGLWSGAWYPTSESETHMKGNLYNRGEIKINLLPIGLTLRGQVLNRQPLLFDSKFDNNWFDNQDFSKTVFNFQGGIYHNSNSKLLFGVIDEWGLPARIRNPWIRSPPYADNHNSIGANLKTSPSSTKNDELYFYLSTPNFKKISAFICAQTEVLSNSEPDKYRQSAYSSGIKFIFEEKSFFSMETFYTGALLKPKNSNTWFSDPPPLPERNFNLYAGNLYFSNPFINISSDIALSETFAWGQGFYANLGISISPKLKLPGSWGSSRIPRPLTISFSADGAQNRFTGRDGTNIDSGNRFAAKIELTKPGNSLLKFNTMLNNTETLSMNFYYRFPNANTQKDIIKITRISISYDQKFYGYTGFLFNFSGLGLNDPIRFDLHFAENPSLSGEFSYSPGIFIYGLQIGYEKNTKNEEIWDFSINGAVRLKKGRFSLKIASPELPKIWNFGLSWRLEI